MEGTAVKVEKEKHAMKLITTIILTSTLIFACASDTPQILPAPEAVPCTIYADLGANPGNSLIAAKISDPCAAKRLIMLAVKLPAVQWVEAYTKEYFEWSTRVRTAIESGISYAALQVALQEDVLALNSKTGMVIVILSDELFRFSERSLLMEKDREMLLLLLDEMDAEVAKMDRMLKNGN